MILDALLYLREACSRHDICDCEETLEEHHCVGEVWTTDDGEYAARLHGVSDPYGRAWFPRPGSRKHEDALDALIGRAQEQEKLEREALPFVTGESP